jgi:hypothetical protein
VNTPNKDLSEILSRTRQALAILAASPEEQIVYLQDLGVGDSADELALELHEGVLMLDQLRDNYLVRDEQSEAIVAVDRKLAEMSGTGRAHLWTWGALERSKEWTEVRELASEALSRLNKP